MPIQYRCITGRYRNQGSRNCCNDVDSLT